MSRELSYTFEECPLIVDRGIPAGLLNGTAEIGFYADGDWYVRKIFLEGYAKSGKAVQVEVENKRGEIYLRIFSELTDGSFKDSIADAVAKELEESGIVPRSDFQEHNTHSRALSGVA